MQASNIARSQNASIISTATIPTNPSTNILSNATALAPTPGPVASQLAANDSLRSPSSQSNLTTIAANMTTAPAGKLSCPCIELNDTALTRTPQYDQQSQCLTVTEPSGQFCYPLEYGLQGCQAYDQQLEPYCDQQAKVPGNPDWCSKSFCYIDANNCTEANFPSTFFPDANLYYSYSTCGESNTFLSMINSDLQHSFMELVSAVEKNLVSTKANIESSYAEIQQFSQNAQTRPQNCKTNNGCDPILEGGHNSCWNTKVDFNGVSVAIHPTLQAINAKHDLDVLACSADVIKNSYLSIAEAEHDDQNRIAYQYYGDQNTGALVEYPQVKLCDENYDARFRPWFAAAASGPKDIVAVIDTSGSMSGNRIELARQATQAVVKTLTWADRVSLLTFSSKVKSVYSEQLVPGNETNVANMVSWIDNEFSSLGGTNFNAPLTKAYEILNANKDANDQQTCSQAILFLTDGEDDTFKLNELQPAIDQNPDTVIFTYGLSADANADKLQQLACATQGIYHPVANEASLPKTMSSYYDYYIKLQDTGATSWIKYQDVLSGVDLLAGCSPVFNYDSHGIKEPDLLGVNCMDLNTIVDLTTLKSCDGNSFDRFIEQVFREATQCADKGPKITNECVLQSMRAKVSTASICSAQTNTQNCNLGPQPKASNFTGLSPNRFQVIPLNGCTKNTTCAALDQSEAARNKSNLSSGAIAGLATGSIVGGSLLLIACICCLKKGRSNQTQINGQQLSNQTGAQVYGQGRVNRPYDRPQYGHADVPPPPGGVDGFYPASAPPMI